MRLQRKTSGNFKDLRKCPTQSRTFKLNSLLAVPSPTNDISKPKPLLHVMDEVSNAFFLVNTGAHVSILPPYQKELSKTSCLNLVAANGS